MIVSHGMCYKIKILPNNYFNTNRFNRLAVLNSIALASLKVALWKPFRWNGGMARKLSFPVKLSITGPNPCFGRGMIGINGVISVVPTCDTLILYYVEINI